MEKSNPEWMIKGEKWIAFALAKLDWKVGDTYAVAYIPSAPIEITQKKHIHQIVPIHWDLEELPNSDNFYLGTPGIFRLNGKYYNPKFKTTGSRKNVDLSPKEDKDEIINLLKIAEKIYEVPE